MHVLKLYPKSASRMNAHSLECRYEEPAHLSAPNVHVLCIAKSNIF